MDRASLAARIQEILKTRKVPAGAEAGATPIPAGQASVHSGPVGQASVLADPRLDPSDESAAFAARCAAAEASSRVLDILGASRLDAPAGPCIVVDRDYPLTHGHGHRSIEHFHAAARMSHAALPLFLERQAGLKTRPTDAALQAGLKTRPTDAAPPRLLFFDLETTGLSGGAGTYAFLLGFGWFGEEGFHTRQYFLRGFGEERALLHAVMREVSDGVGQASSLSTLVTYNGRAFDVPLIETRYQFHRLRSPFETLPHVDMLFPARRLWKHRHDHLGSSTGSLSATSVTGVPAAGPRPPAASRLDAAPGSCALTALERDILGLHREDDVPGWEIPARYFGYARTGDASGLRAVLEHNRLDLISLGAVASVILQMVAEGADAARERPDCLALGRLLESLGRVEDAERCYCAAASDDGMLDTSVDRHVRADALHWLALHRRRARRFHEAADAWQQLADIPGLDAERRREALEALAIHHEHRARDLDAARAFALSALQLSGDARRVDEVRHRLNRLSRKLADRPGATSSLGLDIP